MRTICMTLRVFAGSVALAVLLPVGGCAPTAPRMAPEEQPATRVWPEPRARPANSSASWEI